MVPGTPNLFLELQRLFSLSNEDMSQLGTALAQGLTAFGLDGPSVTQRLQAGASLLEALSLPAGCVDLLYARAHQWFNIGRYDKAEANFRALCVLAGQRRDHWLGYAICLKLNGNIGDADMALQAAARIAPDSALVQCHQLDLAMRRLDWRRAGTHLAAYDACDVAEVPTALRMQAERYRVALDVRQSRPAAEGRA